jgi:hypothetical protein
MTTALALAIVLGVAGYYLQGWLFAILFPAAFLALVSPMAKMANAQTVKFAVRLEEDSKLAAFLGLHAGRIGALCLFGALLLVMLWATPVI